MIVIADSGSTKCDWLILNDNYDIINHVKTMGYNPYFHNEQFISVDLQLNPFFKEHHQAVKELYFYGAGCSSFDLSNIVSNGLQRVFNKAKINVDHDLMASALASYKDLPIISCILGTGSNSCLFDGENIIAGNPALGYVVGDEASGSFFGKILLNAYFYGNLPNDLHKDFEMTYGLTQERFTSNVYSSKRANVYLASFMLFYSTHREHPFIQNIIRNGFREFIQKHIFCFENYKDLEVNFVGSIAFIFQEEMEEVGAEFNLNFGDFIQKPVFSLIDFHKSSKTVKIN